MDVSARSWRTRTCGPGETNIWFLLFQFWGAEVPLTAGLEQRPKEVLVLNLKLSCQLGTVMKRGATGFQTDPDVLLPGYEEPQLGGKTTWVTMGTAGLRGTEFKPALSWF